MLPGVCGSLPPVKSYCLGKYPDCQCFLSRIHCALLFRGEWEESDWITDSPETPPTDPPVFFGQADMLLMGNIAHSEMRTSADCFCYFLC